MLLVFSDDWGRHPSSCQHLVARLLPRQRVLWVNTIGMRAPALNLLTLQRGWEKLRQWSRRTHSASLPATNPQVVSPRMWPWFRTRRDRWLNQELLRRALAPLLERADEPVYAVTTLPIVADLIGELPVERWTYYCVDDFSVWPGLDQKTLAAMERDLVGRCNDVIAVSDELAGRIARLGKRAPVLTHGVDLAFWQDADRSDLAEKLRGFAAPLVVFWGVIDRRMNPAWIRRLASDLPQGTILLVGPRDNPDPELFNHPRVAWLPALPWKQLPELGQLADVLVMPYADLPVTRAMQPLKLKEYLATGKPVVASDLPSVREWQDCLDVAASAEAFSEIVRSRVQSSLPAQQKRARQRLVRESWDAKAAEFEALVLRTASSAKCDEPVRAALSVS